MSVTIQDVLNNARFQQADPTVESGESLLDTSVRWVFTNEREDVASFLTGGELLIVEGQRFISEQWSMDLAQYVDSLVRAQVSALVVELVEQVHEVPEELLAEARLRGLVVIGLHKRIPFVDICQSINTMIVREHMRFQVEVDTMSTALRERLSHVESIESLNSAIAQLFSESVTLFDAEGLPVAQAGQPLQAGERSIIITLRERQRPIATLEMSSRGQPLTKQTCDLIAEVASPVASLFLDGGVRIGMLAHLLAGPQDGVHVTPLEAHDDHDMLAGLGYGASCIYHPFAIRMRSLMHGMPHVSAVFDDIGGQGLTIECLLDGDTMFGWFATTDMTESIAAFNARCHTALVSLAGFAGLLIIDGRTAVDCPNLIDSFAALRDALALYRVDDAALSETGMLRTVAASVLDCAYAQPRTDQAARLLIARAMGTALIQDRVLLDTLCACFDNLDNKTGACEQLGVQRQTLYNRLDKVTLITGVDPADRQAWSMLLLAAKIAATTSHT
ncbi:PucR family transcriptional regulator [Bifidobacterium oedipodis]|uniref:Polyketide synthase n=1 Tax=Bifidobacterium oedipodis TaxID=2675322 RepID=A0A7Y0ENN2_9BIFI|nr:PucR family transcriptional regulator [Bifidobacterium sp. DSM 109957]NMM93629.1 polyketide synthase [Bifidobacterium sp. DSM 109957]